MTGDDAASDRGHRRAAFVLGFSSFFVFPAIPAGSTSAIFLPCLFAGALTVLWVRRISQSDCAPFVWMMAPPVVSASFVVLTGTALAPDVAVKYLPTLAMAYVIVIPTRYLLRTGYGEPFLQGSAHAITLQSALGVYQAFEFERSRFPFQQLMMTSPGLAMPADTIETYVEYVKRPFGLFPEPSAMAACLGPWLVVLAAVLFTPRLQERFRRHRGAHLVALVSGLGLVALSKTGQLLPIAAATGGCVLLPALSSRARPAARVLALLVGAAVIAGALLWITTGAQERFDYAQNDSWQGRLSSLRLALDSLVSMDDDFFFGVGPGQSTWLLRSTSVGGAGAGVTAIWSVTLMYAMETGALGVACMLVLASSMARSIWRSGVTATGAACAAVWFFGLLFGTSYSLPPLWTAMAALLAWEGLTRASRPGSEDERADAALEDGAPGAGDPCCGLEA